MTYDELVAAVLAWTNKAEVEQSIPTFIALAEAQMNRELTEAGIVGATQRDTTTISTEYAAVPTDFHIPQSLTLAGYAVENVTAAGVEDLRVRHPAQSNARPTHFSVVGGQLRFWPVPDAGYVAILTYIRTIPALGPLAPSNWVLAAHPDAYLYGSLVQTAPFLGDDTRLATWSSLYDAAMAGIVSTERAKRGSQGTPAYRPHMPHLHHSHGAC